MKKYKIEYLDELPLMSFGIVRIVGKQPYFDWINTLFDDFELEEDDRFDQGISLMIDGEWLEDRVTKFVKMNHKAIFEYMLFSWYTDDDKWPKVLSYKRFNEWFDWSFNSMIFKV